MVHYRRTWCLACETELGWMHISISMSSSGNRSTINNSNHWCHVSEFLRFLASRLYEQLRTQLATSSSLACNLRHKLSLRNPDITMASVGSGSSSAVVLAHQSSHSDLSQASSTGAAEAQATSAQQTVPPPPAPLPGTTYAERQHSNAGLCRRCWTNCGPPTAIEKLHKIGNSYFQAMVFGGCNGARRAIDVP